MFQRWNLCGFSLNWFSSTDVTLLFSWKSTKVLQAFNVKPLNSNMGTGKNIYGNTLSKIYNYMYIYRNKIFIWLWCVTCTHEANVALSAYQIKYNSESRVEL